MKIGSIGRFVNTVKTTLIQLPSFFLLTVWLVYLSVTPVSEAQ